MQIIGDLFNIIIFVTMVGGVFTVVSLLICRVLHFNLPLWFGICGMAVYVVPLPAPGLYLVPPQQHQWVRGYTIACIIWVCGVALLMLCDIVRSLLAYHAVSRLCPCDDERITDICHRCAQKTWLKRTPPVYWGKLNDSVCVVGSLRPVILVKKEVTTQLSGEELLIVLSHEIAHIRRGHMILDRIFDLCCILNWFNPFVWIARKEFSFTCEMDCDRAVLSSLRNEITSTDYACTLLRLLELSVVRAGLMGRGMKATGFLDARNRMEMIINRPSRWKRCMAVSIMVLAMAAAIGFSFMASRSHFYPYPAYGTSMEYSSDYAPSYLCNRTTYVDKTVTER